MGGRRDGDIGICVNFREMEISANPPRPWASRRVDPEGASKPQNPPNPPDPGEGFTPPPPSPQGSCQALRFFFLGGPPLLKMGFPSRRRAIFGHPAAFSQALLFFLKGAAPFGTEKAAARPGKKKQRSTRGGFGCFLEGSRGRPRLIWQYSVPRVRR